MLTPPAVIAAEAIPIEKVVERSPPGTEVVQLSPAPGTTLRGLFVPAQPGAPVVLHLLESSATVGMARPWHQDLFRHLVDLGLASLMVDYAGVGLSSGERSPDHLLRDARAMWEEALRRAGGDPARVIVRGASLGTISTSLLLRDGVRPGLVVLILPVRAETVVTRFARSFYGLLPGLAASWLYAPVTDVDVVREIAGFEGPLLVIGTTGEILLSDEEQADLEAAVARAGGRWRTRPGGHLSVAAEARAGLPEELVHYASLFPPPRATPEEVARLVERLPADDAERLAPGSAERGRAAECLSYGRTADPRWLVATALSAVDPVDATRLRWALEDAAPREAPLEERLALADLSDPDGPLPIAALEACRSPFQSARRAAGMVWGPSTADILIGARRHGEGLRISARITYPGGIEAEIGSDFPAVWRALATSGLPEEDLQRRFARVLLKACGHADRLVVDGEGHRLRLQVCQGGAWRDARLEDEKAFALENFTIKSGGAEATGCPGGTPPGQ